MGKNFAHRKSGENFPHPKFVGKIFPKFGEKNTEFFTTTFSNHVLEIDVDLIEKSFNALYSATPSGSRLAAREVINIFRWISLDFAPLKFLRYRKFQQYFLKKTAFLTDV